MKADPRSEMEAALKRIVIPELRRVGFTGSFPHFRRVRQALDLVTFQFDRHGGGFVIEVATGELAGFTTHWGKHIPAAKLTAWDLHPHQRKRLKPATGSGTDSWFRYDASQPPDMVARDALNHLRQEYPDADPGPSPNSRPARGCGSSGASGGPSESLGNSSSRDGPPSVS